MKFTSFLSRLAILAVAAALGGLALNTLVFALFAGAASTLVLIIAAADYNRRWPRDYAVLAAPRAANANEAMPLAA